MAADVLAKKVSPKRLSTGWEENCRRNVSSKDGWKKIYDDYNINYQKTCFCSHHIEDIIKKNKTCLGYVPFFFSAPRPLGAAYVPILLSEVDEEQRPSGNGDREAIVVRAGLCDSEGERAYTAHAPHYIFFASRTNVFSFLEDVSATILSPKRPLPYCHRIICHRNVQNPPLSRYVFAPVQPPLARWEHERPKGPRSTSGNVGISES